MDITEIKKLANLSRIYIKGEEAKDLAKDFDSILAYVDQIKEVSNGDSTQDEYFLTNVTREDENINQGGGQTKDILQNAPQTEDGFIKVKQIL
jgi:aspartyl/glutamyl-tRNA(Asn/Gln) amidotransferase C subunit